MKNLISKCCGAKVSINETMTITPFNGKSHPAYFCKSCGQPCEVIEPKDEKEEVNYMQVGKKLECGHCHPEKFGEGLKELERVIPNYKCDCICHDKTPTPNEKIEEIKQFLGRVIFDCFHNNIEINDSACNGVTNYICNGTGDNKFLENYLEWFDDYSQSIKLEVEEEWRGKIRETIKYLEGVPTFERGLEDLDNLKNLLQ